MSTAPLVSVVIPSFNTEKYIQDALNSLLAQGIDELLEVIVIDDASKDKTVDITRKWAEQNAHRLYSFQHHCFDSNQGVSLARNKGIELAQGEWVIFLDSDDIFLNKAFSKFQKKLSEDSNTEIIYSPIKALNIPKPETVFTPNWDEKVYKGNALYSFYRSRKDLVPIMDVCLSIFFRKKFLIEKNLSFTSGMIFLEDAAFIAKSFAVAQKTIFQMTPFYHLRVYPESTSHQQKIYEKDSLNGHINGIKDLLLFNKKHFNDPNRSFLQGLIIKFSLLPYQAAIGTNFFHFSKHKWVHHTMKAEGLYPINLNTRNYYLRSLAKKANFSIYYFYAYWWFRLLKISLTNRFKKHATV